MEMTSPISSLPPPPPIEERVAELHARLRAELPGVSRIALAVYDSQTDLLKTFASSNVGDNPLRRHEARLGDLESLLQLSKTGKGRVIQDLSVLDESSSLHSQVISQRYGSSYTKPLFEGDHLRGFLFYDADNKGYFTESVVHRLHVFSDLAALLLSSTLFPARMLKSAVHAASHVSHTRDPETGAHLERMARYARTIALELAEAHELSSAYIEHLLTFAPLHDVGKVGVPDAVLLKPGRLTDEEFVIMRSHVDKGVELIDELLDSLGIRALPYVGMLRNIILCHHEAYNGSGYPHHRVGDEIPLEARIVTVADVFDALTSKRPYKEAWPVERARDYMRENAGELFDPQCVAALESAWPRIMEIRDTFPDAGHALREGYTAEV